MSNNYSTPESALVSVEAAEGSLEAGIAGDYEFKVFDVLSEAWERTKGVKLFIIGGGIAMIAISMVMAFVLSFLIGLVGAVLHVPMLAVAGTFIAQVLSNIVTMPIAAGIFVICLKQVQDRGTDFGEVFSHFDKAIPLFLTFLLLYILMVIGFLLFIIPGIYLAVSYVLALPLVIDRNLSPWEALEASRKALTKRWFSVFGLLLMMGLIMMVSMIPFGIGLIWTAPMMALSYAVLYRQVFGIANY